MKINNAEILCVGTEILIGDIVNTNAAYISKKLAQMGINQYYQAVVGDNPKRLSDAIKSALLRCDLLIMSGGLGPTYDDLTKETVAECMGRRLVLDENSLERIKSNFALRHRIMTDNNIKQAMIPENAVIFENNAGTAPGCAIEDFDKGKIIIMLPGPPHELIRMFEESVIPYLKQFTSARLVSKNIEIFGMGESEVESHLKSLMESSSNPTIAPYCGDGEVRLRITASGDNDDVCAKMCNEMIELIRLTPVRDYIYGVDTTIAEALVKKFSKNKKNLSVAESCTGGLIAKRITDIPGSSEVLGYGVVAYANEAKIRVLGVKPETLEKYGAVSEQTAIEMADGIRRLSGSDVGISTTGIAGPGGGSEKKPVGLVYAGVSSDKGSFAVRLDFGGDRDRVRLLAASSTLLMAIKEIE